MIESRRNHSNKPVQKLQPGTPIRAVSFLVFCFQLAILNLPLPAQSFSLTPDPAGTAAPAASDPASASRTTIPTTTNPASASGASDPASASRATTPTGTAAPAASDPASASRAAIPTTTNPASASGASAPVSASGTTTPASASRATTPAGAALPKTYRAFSLGMSLEDLKKALLADDLFAFRGDRDVSLLPMSEQTLVETTGLSFIKRAFFQLKDGKVFIMAFTLNTDKIDHYSVFTTLVQKYGEPKELNPREAVWVSDTVRLSIERPLTVKYIDLEVFNGIIEASAVKESKEAVLRKEFLNDF
ncbi:MAG: hypothetical protein ACOZCE_06370 [Spirochaetota bacterium]